MKLANFEATKNHRLCSKHFEARFFYKSAQKIKLLGQAVPTIFLELPKYTQLSRVPERGKNRSFKKSKEETKKSRLSNEPLPSTSYDGLEDLPRKKELHRRLFQEVAKNKIKSNKIKRLGERVHRHKKKIITLKGMVRNLKEKNLISEENALLFENVPEIYKLLRKRKLGEKVKYPPEQ